MAVGGRKPAVTVNTDAGKAVVNAYYPALLGSADAARSRAQNGYTIASAIAAALVAAGVFGGFADATTAVRILGVLALMLWLAAASAFMYAVAGRVTMPEGKVETLTELVEALVNWVTDARDRVERRAAWAQGLTGGAIVVTAAALIAAAFSLSRSGEISARVLLSRHGGVEVMAMCHKHVSMLHARIDPKTLDQATVKLVTDAGFCGKGQVALRVRSMDVVAISQRNGA